MKHNIPNLVYKLRLARIELRDCDPVVADMLADAADAMECMYADHRALFGLENTETEWPLCDLWQTIEILTGDSDPMCAGVGTAPEAARILMAKLARQSVSNTPLAK
jgi:hypothetical protein